MMDKIVKGYPNWDIPLNANIDEYNTTMGNAELLTEDKTVKGAINEIKTGNDETIKKIKDDTQINTADISNLKTSVAQNTASLNHIAIDFKQRGGISGDSTSEVGLQNTNLLQTLINSLYQSGGGTIFFPQGTFYFAPVDTDTCVTMRSNVNLIGCGKGITTLAVIESTSTTGGYSLIVGTNLKNIIFKDFTVDMYNQNMTYYSSKGKAFYINILKNSKWKDVEIKGTPSTGLGTDHLTDVVIDNVTCYECGRLWGTVPIKNGTRTFDASNPFSSMDFPGGAGIGIGTGKTDNESFKIVNCTTEKCGHFGIFVEHQYIYATSVTYESKDIVIADNICRNNRYAGLGIRGGTRINMSGNISVGNGCYGLNIDTEGKIADCVTLRDSLINENTFDNNGISGINIDGCCNIDGLDIKNNKLNYNKYPITLGLYNFDDFIATTQRNIVIKNNVGYGNANNYIYKDEVRINNYVNLIDSNNEFLDKPEASALSTIINSDNKLLEFNKTWSDSLSSTLYGGVGKMSDVIAAEIILNFTGTGVKVIAPKSNSKGRVRMLLDNETTGEIVDLYSDATEKSRTVYARSGLENKSHKLIFRCMGDKNDLSIGKSVTLDAFIIAGKVNNINTIEEDNSKITYTGIWSDTSNAQFSGGNAKITSTTDSSLMFSFTGSKIEVLGANGNNKGIATVTIDGTETQIDLYNGTTQYKKVLFSKDNLADTTHTITIKCTGAKNASSTGNIIAIDSFNITGGTIIAQ